MSQASFEVYINQMLAQKNGFPLYYPAPPANHPLVVQKRGISIGDVGFINAGGFFQYAFNIFVPRPATGRSPDSRIIWVDDSGDTSINCYGVPDDFEPIPWNPDLDVESEDDKHAKNSALMSQGVTKHDFNANLDTGTIGDG